MLEDETSQKGRKAGEGRRGGERIWWRKGREQVAGGGHGEQGAEMPAASWGGAQPGHPQGKLHRLC